MNPPFLDANVLVRLFAQDHSEHSPIAEAVHRQIESGQLRVTVSATVVFETVFVLQKVYGWDRSAIREALLGLIELDGFELPDKALYQSIFDLYVNRKSLSFADCSHAVFSMHLHCEALISFDTDFEKVPNLTRIDPSVHFS